MRARWGERGSVAAELALALPAVVLTLLLGVGALSAAACQVALQDAASDAARLLGRGEDEGAASQTLHAAVPDARLSSESVGDLVCVSVSSEMAVGRLLRLPLRASSCAFEGGL